MQGWRKARSLKHALGHGCMEATSLPGHTILLVRGTQSSPKPMSISSGPSSPLAQEWHLGEGYLFFLSLKSMDHIYVVSSGLVHR